MEIDELRAQLAEAQALLRAQDELLSQAYQHDIGTPLKRQIRAAALSASAEPSAPVEIDELKPCPFCGCQVTLLTDFENVRIIGQHVRSCPFLDMDVIVDGRAAWQARAALGRKP